MNEIDDVAPPVDPVESAKAAKLRYVCDSMPGIRREKRDDTFRYLSSKGEEITDAATLARIHSLAIPPAYTDVWICPIENGHLQATARDARGRKQYRYHPRWRESRDETKYHRMLDFADALPKLRARVERDLARPGLPREKVLATIVKLLETTNIRIGNEEYAQRNAHYGLTTLRPEHVDVQGTTIHFNFVGKSGKAHTIDLRDKRLARIVRQCQELPGHELFQYKDAEGQPHTIHSEDVNAYLHEAAGEEFTAKDFRTWTGTILCALCLAEVADFCSPTEAKRNITTAIKQVSARLGNTPAICRKCYVHPAVLEHYLDKTLTAALQTQSETTVLASSTETIDKFMLGAEEIAVLNLLRGSKAAH